MPATAAIGTLRLTGAAADTPALRLRAARELAGADLSPPGLPPAAVLVVRRLADPLPRRLAGREPRLRPDAAWERAVRERLAAALRSAARPDPHGVVPAEAPALVFADEAELLACVVRQRVRGELAALWWWRAVRRRLPPAATAGLENGRDPSPFLAACPREAPAALAWLARWGEAAAVAAAFTPASAKRVLAALAAEHGLPPDLVAASGEKESEMSDPGDPDVGSAAPTSTVPPEPWRDWLPSEFLAVPLAPEVRYLFGVALGLAAAPHRLRSADVIEKARRSWLPLSPFTRPPSTGSGEPANGSGAPSTAGGGTSTAGGEASAAGGETSTAGGEASTAGGEASTAGGEASTAGGEASTAGGGTSTGGGETSAAGGGTPAGSGGRRAGSGGPTAERERLAPRLCAGATATLEPRPAPAVSSEVTQRKTPAWGEEGIATRIGGVLYLIHALLDLGLPEAFEPGWRLASAAGPWGTLDLLGRGLLGARFAEVAGDPLWVALAELAGWLSVDRKGSLRTAYRVPADWPKKLADPCYGFAWSAAGGRLRVWSAAGYLIADVRRGPDKPSRQARRELARLAGVPDDARLIRRQAAAAPLVRLLPPLPPGCPPHLGRWLAAALPAVRRRLLLALAGRRAAPGRRDPVARALAVRGRLYLTSSHVDLVLPLAAAELAARRAGLDRDPGWLPAFGRVVSFHFA